jgi:hypothetical protein
LGFRKLHREAEALQNLSHGQADFRKELIDNAGDE